MDLSLSQMAFWALAAAAAGGLSLALLRALGLKLPRWLGAGHGLLATCALVFLAYALMDLVSVPATVLWALAVLAAAGLGGLSLFRWLSPQRRPGLLVLLHGATALLGLAMLYLSVF
jgi:hypothetical protein